MTDDWREHVWLLTYWDNSHGTQVVGVLGRPDWPLAVEMVNAGPVANYGGPQLAAEPATNNDTSMAVHMGAYVVTLERMIVTP